MTQLRRLRWVLLCALLALGATGCNGRKKEVPKAEPRQSAIIATEAAPGSAWKMSLRMDPAQPRFAAKTRFRVRVMDPEGRPVSGAQLHGSLVMPLMDMGKNEFALSPSGDGEYEGSGEFSMAGEWEVMVTAASAGKTGKYTFNVRVEE